jgi:hypothetical protein
VPRRQVAPATAPAGGSVVLAFLPAGPRRLLAAGLSAGIMSASQGTYTRAQLLLDIGQGARIASSAYPGPRPPAMALRRSGAGATIAGWRAARRRAEDAPQLLRPGLLAGSVPGGGAYAGVNHADSLDAIAAADRAGRVSAVSLGPARTLALRVAALTARRRLVVADLPGGADGVAQLRALQAMRAAGELLLVVQRAQDGAAHQLLWIAAAGLAGGGERELSSRTTRQRGLVASIDLAPTILRHLGIRPLPGAARGAPMRADGALQRASLRGLMARLRVISARKLRALAWLLCAWTVLLCAFARARANGHRWAMRTGALGILWTPLVALLPAALEPSAPVEYAIIALGAPALGALTDHLLAWPRAPLAPAVIVLGALAADALAGTQLLMRSLLGPDPILGARFYGIGNELKSGLAVLVLAGLAAVLYPARRDRRALATIAAAGVALAVVEGSARIGAGVGGVILVSAGFAVACVLLAPGALTRRRGLAVIAAPIAGLAALAALDLLTAHGSGHYTGSILHARSAADLRDVLVRRYKAAWDELANHAMPAATAVALGASAAALAQRGRLLAVVDGDPAWWAALAGGLAAGVVGALFEDSGPVLLVVAVFTLGCVLSYLWGRPARHAVSASQRRRGALGVAA